MLDKRSDIPLYLQLYGYIKHEIETGALRENTRLPSIRRLSAYLKLSKNTVETAYQQLIAEGYAESRQRSGLYVVAPEWPAGAEVISPRPPEQTVSRMSISSGVPIRFDFRYGDIALSHFPVRQWSRCLAKAVAVEPQEALLYGHPEGNGELRTEIAAYLRQSRGVICSPDQLFICSGTQNSVSMLCQLLPLSGQRIAMEEPGYRGVRTVFLNHGCDLVPIPLDPDGLQTESLRTAAAKAVYVTPSHQYPMGMVLPIHKRNKLLQWAHEQDALIIEDDYDSEFRYVGQPIPALKALDGEGRVIYMGTFSKSFLPSARLSYLVLPEPLTGTYRRGIANYSPSASPLLQQAMLLFMREGHFERHVRRMRRLYQTRHRALLAAIHKHLGDTVEIIGQKAGLHLLLNVKNRESSDLIAQAARYGVKVYSPLDHWHDPRRGPSSCIILGFGGLDEAEIEAGIAKLAEAWA